MKSNIESASPIGRVLYKVAICHDSMAWARSHLTTAPDGSVFIAHRLTKARGQYGRVWQIKPGQLLITILLKPIRLANYISETSSDDVLQSLNQALALGISDPLLTYGARIKYPNDIMLDHKKICGLLIEPVWYGRKIAGIIFGFGLNLTTQFSHHDPLSPIATSVYQATHYTPDEQRSLMDLFNGLNKWYTIWNCKDDAFIKSMWLQRAVSIL